MQVWCKSHGFFCPSEIIIYNMDNMGNINIYLFIDAMFCVYWFVIITKFAATKKDIVEKNLIASAFEKFYCWLIIYDFDVKQAFSYVIYMYICMYATSKTLTIYSWINWLYKKLDRFDIWKIIPYRSISISSSRSTNLGKKWQRYLYLLPIIFTQFAAADKKYW